MLGVQTRAKADIARSLASETGPHTELHPLLQAAVQARYMLAVEAINAFHTGVSEDFLLKQEQFKDVRDRLLKSASDFYGKLGALLGKESDLASRRAVGQANFEVAELTEKVGKPDDAPGGTPAESSLLAKAWRPKPRPTRRAKLTWGAA